MIYDISMGLNGIPLCINVKYKGKSFISIEEGAIFNIEWSPTNLFKWILMIYDISMGLNEIPLCINVYPINLERKSFNSIEEGAPFNIEWNPTD